MSPTWQQRKNQLVSFLDHDEEDEDRIGFKLDELCFGKESTGRPDTRSKLDSVRFTDRDVETHGVLAIGQFGTVELVTCKLDGRVYVRKRMPKKTILKHREQCAPLTERRIHRTALKELSSWVPQMLCAYQCRDFLNIVMEYAEGGSLWDVIESSPDDGKLSLKDLRWWVPQCVSAIEWCHQQGFAHRDVKPHNFVFRTDGHLMLIDFGSAAPLLPPQDDGVQHIPREYCLVPCGTCDYVSPEILKAHEEALVALEMSDDDLDNSSTSSRRRTKHCDSREAGYGRETDWWSLGAMVYEMAFGVAPFFANDVRHTYVRIMNHTTSLTFDDTQIHPVLVSLLKGLLTDHKSRLGRHSVEDLKSHPFFDGIDWITLPYLLAPSSLLLPQFTYNAPPIVTQDGDANDSQSLSSSTDSSRPFVFSALFQSSVNSTSDTFNDQNFVTPVKSHRSFTHSANTVHAELASFIGFSWGPQKDAFDDAAPQESVWRPTPMSKTIDELAARAQSLAPITPARPSAPRIEGMSTIRVTRGWSTVKRSQHRPVTDREAMKQLVDCIGMSARKRVLESGKKPRILQPQLDGWTGSFGRSILRSVSASVPGTVRKELRFHDKTFESNVSAYAQEITYEASETSDSEVPPSPSPSPRPGSAMSMISMSRRSATPTATGLGNFPPFPRGNRSEPIVPLRSASAFTASVEFRPGESTSTPRAERIRRRASDNRLRRESPPPAAVVEGRRENTTTSRGPSNESLDKLEQRYVCLTKNLKTIGVQLRSISMRLERT